MKSLLVSASLLMVVSTTHGFYHPSVSTNAFVTPRPLKTATSSTSTSEDVALPPAFEAAYQQTLDLLEGKIPPAMEAPLVHFITEYFGAASANPTATPEQTTKNILNAIKFGTAYGVGPDRYTFGNTHVALRGGEESNPAGSVDFYGFGVDFFRAAIDLPRSVVLGKENAAKAFEYVAKGENVVFLANHQSEADPQVFSVLLEESGYSDEAADIYYVAGHKVTTDALAIPFSMGRNLICIHSKKHIDAEPELKSQKQKQNLSSMNTMLKLMKKGGLALWVAPSGGRDRRDIATNEIPLAPFDQKTVDMFRLMANKSQVPTHFFPLAMSSYALCPPPDTVEAGVGEQRNVRYTPLGIAVGEEIPNTGGVDSRHLFTEEAYAECQRDYQKILEALEEKNKEVSSSTSSDAEELPPPPPL